MTTTYQQATIQSSEINLKNPIGVKLKDKTYSIKIGSTTDSATYSTTEYVGPITDTSDPIILSGSNYICNWSITEGKPGADTSETRVYQLYAVNTDTFSGNNYESQFIDEISVVENGSAYTSTVYFSPRTDFSYFLVKKVRAISEYTGTQAVYKPSLEYKELSKSNISGNISHIGVWSSSANQPFFLDNFPLKTHNNYYYEFNAPNSNYYVSSFTPAANCNYVIDYVTENETKGGN